MVISEIPETEKNLNIESIHQETTFVPKGSDHQSQQDSGISITSEMVSSHDSSTNNQDMNTLPPPPIIMQSLIDLSKKKNLSDLDEDEFVNPTRNTISKFKKYFNSGSRDPKIPLSTFPSYGAIPLSSSEEQPTLRVTPPVREAQIPSEGFTFMIYFCVFGFIFVCIAFFITLFIIGPKAKTSP